MKKNTRTEFFNREGNRDLDTVTIRFKDGKEYTLSACTPNTTVPDGLFIFVQAEEGVGVVGGGSPQFVSFMKDAILPDMLVQSQAQTTSGKDPMEQLLAMMGRLDDDDNGLN